MKKYKIRLYLVDGIIFIVRAVFIVASLFALGTLFKEEFTITAILIASLTSSIALTLIRTFNRKEIIKLMEAELKYSTSNQVIFDLRKGEIVCFKLSDDLGTLKLISDNELMMHLQKNDNTMYKTLQEEDDLRNVIEDLMGVSNLFKNGILFRAEIVTVEDVEGLIDVEKKLQGDH